MSLTCEKFNDSIERQKHNFGVQKPQNEKVFSMVQTCDFSYINVRFDFSQQ